MHTYLDHNQATSCGLKLIDDFLRKLDSLEQQRVCWDDLVEGVNWLLRPKSLEAIESNTA